MEDNISKRTGRIFGPDQGKKLRIFIDDLSMPKIETWRPKFVRCPFWKAQKKTQKTDWTDIFSIILTNQKLFWKMWALEIGGFAKDLYGTQQPLALLKFLMESCLVKITLSKSKQVPSLSTSGMFMYERGGDLDKIIIQVQQIVIFMEGLSLFLGMDPIVIQCQYILIRVG